MRTLKPIGQLAGAVHGGTPSFNALAWAGADGRELWAGGGIADTEGRIVVRRWKDIGAPGRYQDLAVARSSRVIEAAGRDHLILSDPSTGIRYLLLMVNVDYVTFDEPINYEYPFQGGIVTQQTPFPTSARDDGYTE